MQEILEPELAIVDPHHHLWDNRAWIAEAPAGVHPLIDLLRQKPVYSIDDLLADLGGGHDVRATVYLECSQHYRDRADGPPLLRSVGETEHVARIAELAAGRGGTRVCEGIVAFADLRLGDAVAPVLEAHVSAAGGRLRGIRQSAAWHSDPTVLGPLARAKQGLLLSEAFRAGFARLAPLGLVFDALVFESQLGDVVDLAHAFPETAIVLNHMAQPLGRSAAGSRADGLKTWREDIRLLATCPNVTVKVGGLSVTLGFPSYLADPPAAAATLAEEWRPYIETTIAAFGPERCMFESNFPVDAGSCSYVTLWNIYKGLVASYSANEKAALFAQTAARVYRLTL